MTVDAKSAVNPAAGLPPFFSGPKFLTLSAGGKPVDDLGDHGKQAGDPPENPHRLT